MLCLHQTIDIGKDEPAGLGDNVWRVSLTIPFINRAARVVFLVQGATLTSSLQLRLGEGWDAQLPVLERWANAQLRDHPQAGLAWERLPQELHASGEPLRQALRIYAKREDGQNRVLRAAEGFSNYFPGFDNFPAWNDVIL